MSWETFDGQAYGRAVAFSACTAEMLQAQKDLKAAPQRERQAQIERLKARILNTNTKPACAQPAATRSKR